MIFFVHMRQFHIDFYCFFDVLDRIFFDGFSNPFIVHFRTSYYVWNNFPLIASGFCSHVAFLTYIFCLFNFLFFFFWKWFSHFTHSPFSLNCTSEVVLQFFFTYVSSTLDDNKISLKHQMIYLIKGKFILENQTKIAEQLIWSGRQRLHIILWTHCSKHWHTVYRPIQLNSFFFMHLHCCTAAWNISKNKIKVASNSAV